MRYKIFYKYKRYINTVTATIINENKNLKDLKIPYLFIFLIINIFTLIVYFNNSYKYKF